MPFGLRNAGATYQRCMQKCLQDQLDKNVQVYFDDVVIKNKQSHTLIEDLRQTFANLRKFWMKLNPENVHLASRLASYSDSLYPAEESKPTRQRSGPSKEWNCQKPSMMSRSFTGCLASLSRFVSRVG